MKMSLSLQFLLLGVLGGLLLGAVFSTNVVPMMVGTEHGKDALLDPDVAKYDTFDIANCLGIAQVSEDVKDLTDLKGFQIVGISDCLLAAATRAIEAKRAKAANRA